jgi:hypothetical protein
MNLHLDVPEALRPNFQRVYRRIPMELRQNSEFLQDLVLYLKVGGERLARQHLEVAKNDLKLVKTAQRKERRREAMRRTAEAAAESDEAGVMDVEDADNDEVDDDDDDDIMEDEIHAEDEEDEED